MFSCSIASSSGVSSSSGTGSKRSQGMPGPIDNSSLVAEPLFKVGTLTGEGWLFFCFCFCTRLLFRCFSVRRPSETRHAVGAAPRFRVGARFVVESVFFVVRRASTSTATGDSTTQQQRSRIRAVSVESAHIETPRPTNRTSRRLG